MTVPRRAARGTPSPDDGRRTPTGITRVLLLVALVLGLVAPTAAATAASAATPHRALGCKDRCILDQSVVRGPFAVTMKIRTAVLARLTVTMVERTVNGKPATTKHLKYVATPTWQTQHTVGFNNLQAGTVYDVEVIATDRQGRSERRKSTVTTLRREVVFWIHRIDILNDADSDGPGELSFSAYIGSEGWHAETMDQRRVNTGDRVTINAPTRHLGLGPLNVMTVKGRECDEIFWGCGADHGSSDRATAGHLIDVDHPGTRGTSRTAPPGIPSGHFGYATFLTERGSYLRFKVYAYWDIQYVP